jgi:sugar phosphate isomerase/epimerase
VDTADHHPTPDEAVHLLRGLMPEFEAAGVVLAIENHDRFKAQTLAEIIGQIGSQNVGICLDTVNSMGAGQGAETVVEQLGRYVVNLHVKDFIVRRHPHMLGFEVIGAPAGQGQLDIPWLLARLGQFGRAFNAILELWPPPEAQVERTVQKEAEWVQASLVYLRRLIPDTSTTTTT